MGLISDYVKKIYFWILLVSIEMKEYFFKKMNINVCSRTEKYPDVCRVSLYITSRCNLSCNMCGYQTDKSSGTYKTVGYPDMTFERYKHILNFFPKLSSIAITAEGEPFLNKDVFRMIRYAKDELKVVIDTSTNGIIIDKYIDEIIDSGLDKINISLESDNFEEYYNIRSGTRDQYNKVISNLKLLCEKRKEKKSKLHISVSFITTINNYKLIPNKLDFCKQFEIDAVIFQNSLDFLTEFSKQNRPIFETDEEAVKFIGNIKKPEGLKNVDVRLPTIFRMKPPKLKGEKLCSYPYVTVGINTYGDVNPCCYVNTDEKYGNIFLERDFWDNSSYERIRELLERSVLPLDLCKTCGNYGIKRLI